MRTPFRRTRPSQTSLRVMYVCCALCGASATALAEPGQITPTPVVSTPAPAPATVANNSTARTGSILFDRRVLTLLAMGFLGLIAGWISRDPREPRVHLLNKPKKTRLPILVPPGPAPRLIPSDSPNATRPRSTRAPLTRQTPIGAARPRVIDYIAAFADSAEANEGGRVDYLLVSSDVEEVLDPPGGLDGSSRDTG